MKNGNRAILSYPVHSISFILSIKHNIDSRLFMHTLPVFVQKTLKNTYIFSILQSGVYKMICKMLKISWKRKKTKKMFVFAKIGRIFASSNKNKSNSLITQS